LKRENGPRQEMVQKRKEVRSSSFRKGNGEETIQRGSLRYGGRVIEKGAKKKKSNGGKKMKTNIRWGSSDQGKKMVKFDGKNTTHPKKGRRG